jgi:hypothetical protein
MDKSTFPQNPLASPPSVHRPNVPDDVGERRHLPVADEPMGVAFIGSDKVTGRGKYASASRPAPEPVLHAKPEPTQNGTESTGDAFLDGNEA